MLVSLDFRLVFPVTKEYTSDCPARELFCVHFKAKVLGLPAGGRVPVRTMPFDFDQLRDVLLGFVPFE